MPKSEKTAVIEPETAEPTPKTESAKGKSREKKKRGRPFAGTDRIPVIQRFWQRVAAIEDADFGTRAWFHIYRTRPLIDRMRSGQPKKLGRFGFKLDEEWIKQNHGSGSYRVYLNWKAPGADEKEIDTVEVDIFDPAFPPNILDVEFLKIPENADWEWCRGLLKDASQKATPAASQTSDIVQAMQVVGEITKQAREDAAQPEKTEQPTMLEIIKTVKEMFPPPPPPPPATENKMLDTIVAMMNKQIDSQAAANAELRKEITDMRKQPEEKKGGALGTLKEIITEAKGLLPDLKEMFPGFGQSVSGAVRAVRSNMSPDQEFWQPIVTKIIDGIAPAAPFFIQKLMTPNQPPGAPTVPPNQPTLPQAPTGAPAPPTSGNGQPPPAATEPQPEAFDRRQAFEFLKLHAKPFLQWFKEGQTGEAFATHLFDLYGAEWNGLPWLAAKASEGASSFVARFKTSPWWFEIADAEDRFTEYVEAFVAWKPAAADTIIDLDDQGVQEAN